MFHHLRSKVLGIPGELFEADRPPFHKLLVVELFLDQDPAHPQGQGAVGAGTNRDPFRIRVLGHDRPAGIDHHQAGPPPVRLLDLDKIIRRTVGRRVFPPDDDEVGVLDVREHVDEHAPHGHMGGDHGEGYVAEGPYAEGVGRPEREQDTGSRGNRHPGGLEDVA